MAADGTAFLTPVDAERAPGSDGRSAGPNYSESMAQLAEDHPETFDAIQAYAEELVAAAPPITEEGRVRIRDIFASSRREVIRAQLARNVHQKAG